MIFCLLFATKKHDFCLLFVAACPFSAPKNKTFIQPIHPIVFLCGFFIMDNKAAAHFDFISTPPPTSISIPLTHTMGFSRQQVLFPFLHPTSNIRQAWGQEVYQKDDAIHYLNTKPIHEIKQLSLRPETYQTMLTTLEACQKLLRDTSFNLDHMYSSFYMCGSALGFPYMCFFLPEFISFYRLYHDRTGRPFTLYIDIGDMRQMMQRHPNYPFANHFRIFASQLARLVRDADRTTINIYLLHAGDYFFRPRITDDMESFFSVDSCYALLVAYRIHCVFDTLEEAKASVFYAMQPRLVHYMEATLSSSSSSSSLVPQLPPPPPLPSLVLSSFAIIKRKRSHQQDDESITNSNKKKPCLFV